MPIGIGNNSEVLPLRIKSTIIKKKKNKLKTRFTRNTRNSRQPSNCAASSLLDLISDSSRMYLKVTALVQRNSSQSEVVRRVKMSPYLRHYLMGHESLDSCQTKLGDFWLFGTTAHQERLHNLRAVLL